MLSIDCTVLYCTVLSFFTDSRKILVFICANVCIVFVPRKWRNQKKKNLLSFQRSRILCIKGKWIFFLSSSFSFSFSFINFHFLSIYHLASVHTGCVAVAPIAAVLVIVVVAVCLVIYLAWLYTWTMLCIQPKFVGLIIFIEWPLFWILCHRQTVWWAA